MSQQRTTSYPGDCVECQTPLNQYAIQHGWVTSDVGYRRPPARVHTVCRGRFERRPLEERQARVQAQWDSL